MYRSFDGTELAVVAETWRLNPKVSFESLAPEFRVNAPKAWRDYGSVIRGGSLDRALQDPDAARAHINQTREDPWDYARDTFHPWFRGRPRNRTYIHIDLAKKKDAAGIAAVHREPTGVVVVDFMHAHRPRPGQNIQFAELRERYVYGLHARGFTIAMITFDQWQSIEMRQTLEGKGFQTDEVSADRTTGPYDTLIEMLLADRVEYYNHPVFLKEMEELEVVDRGGTGMKYDHPKKGCFVGETRIPLLDGTFPTMAELVGREVLLWASRPDGRVVPARARGRFTKMTTELVDVVLDSGAVERCTLDHLWRLWDGSYLPAADLRFRQRLMPLHWGFMKGDYLRLSDKQRNRGLAHQIVYQHFHGEVPDGCIVHHRDHNKANNHPDNLEASARAEHCRYHTALRHQTDPAWRAKLYEGARRFNKSAEGRAKHAAAIRRTTEERVSARRYNHQVWAVIPVVLSEPVPVYDLEVDEYANFALASGVFVHNSKDVSDAVACATWKSIEQALDNPPEPPGKVKVIRRAVNPYRYERVAW